MKKGERLKRAGVWGEGSSFSCQLGAQLSLSPGQCNLLRPILPAQNGPFVPFSSGEL